MERIESYMSQFPITISEEASVEEALGAMKRYNFRHLPVVRGEQVTGVISERDLRQAEILADAMTVIVADYMTPRPYCVRTGTPILEIAREMAAHKYGSAIVTTPAGKLVGIFTTTDALDLLAKLLAKGEPRPFHGLTIDDYLAHGSLAYA